MPSLSRTTTSSPPPSRSIPPRQQCLRHIHSFQSGQSTSPQGQDHPRIPSPPSASGPTAPHIPPPPWTRGPTSPVHRVYPSSLQAWVNYGSPHVFAGSANSTLTVQPTTHSPTLARPLPSLRLRQSSSLPGRTGLDHLNDPQGYTHNLHVLTPYSCHRPHPRDQQTSACCGPPRALGRPFPLRGRPIGV